MTLKKCIQIFKLYVIEIPATFVLVPVGLFMEFIVTLPFIVICGIDGFFQKKA